MPRPAPSRASLSAPPRPSAIRLPRAAIAVPLGAVLAVAAANFLWNLGSSSLFVDEVYSWSTASAPLGDLIDTLKVQEVSPPGYFAFLHEWNGQLDVSSEWAMRLPSAICAILLIPLLYELGRRLAGPPAGLAAALFGAVSPLVLDYAQQVRVYAPAMLVCACAAACALRAVEEGRRHAGRWAVAAGCLVAIAFAMHYTTVFCTAPLVALLLTRRSLPGWSRGATAGVVGVVVLALLPLMLTQLDGRQAAISPYARLTFENVLSILGTPWDSRNTEPLGYRMLAALITSGSVAWLLVRGTLSGRVIALAAVGPVAGAFAATLVSDDAIITRYTSVSAPFALVAIGVAVTSLSGARRAVLVGGILLLAVFGTTRGHQDGARFANARAAIAYVEPRWRADDVVVTPPNDVTVNLPVRYYVARDLPAGAALIPAEQADDVRAALDRGSRIWYVARKDDLAERLTEAGYPAEVVARYRDEIVPVSLILAAREPG